MKVICIDDKYIYNDGFEPHFGEVVTVAGDCPVYPKSYDLVEYPRNALGKLQSFEKKHFAPLSKIDETEFERNYKKEHV